MVKDILLAIGLATLFFSLLFNVFYKVVVVEGYSMLPTLRNQNVVVIKKKTKIKRFDLIYFKQGNAHQIRRVIGLPGESISYEADNLYVNNKIIDEKFIIDEINTSQKNGGNYTVDFKFTDIYKGEIIPEDHYLVLSDNRSIALDSRQYGLITDDEIVGVVQTVVLPLNDTRFLFVQKAFLQDCYINLKIPKKS